MKSLQSRRKNLRNKKLKGRWSKKVSRTLIRNSAFQDVLSKSLASFSKTLSLSSLMLSASDGSTLLKEVKPF